MSLRTETLYNQDSGIFIHGNVVLGQIKTKQSLKATSFIANGIKQWGLFSHDDFDNVIYIIFMKLMKQQA